MPAKGDVNNPTGNNQYVSNYVRKTVLEQSGKKLNKKIKDQLKDDGIELAVKQLDAPNSDMIDLTEDWYPSTENLKVIYQLAMSGCSEQTIASVGLKVPDEVYFRLRDEYPEINSTIQTARRHGEAIAAVETFNEMIKRDSRNRVAVMQFYLKNRANWAATTHLPLPNLGNDPKVLNDMSDASLTRLLKKQTDLVLDQDE